MFKTETNGGINVSLFYYCRELFNSDQKWYLKNYHELKWALLFNLYSSPSLLFKFVYQVSLSPPIIDKRQSNKPAPNPWSSLKDFSSKADLVSLFLFTLLINFLNSFVGIFIFFKKTGGRASIWYFPPWQGYPYIIRL